MRILNMDYCAFFRSVWFVREFACIGEGKGLRKSASVAIDFRKIAVADLYYTSVRCNVLFVLLRKKYRNDRSYADFAFNREFCFI